MIGKVCGHSHFFLFFSLSVMVCFQHFTIEMGDFMNGSILQSILRKVFAVLLKGTHFSTFHASTIINWLILGFVAQ